MAEFEHRSGKKTSWQPFLKILQLAINKILHNEEESSTKDILKEHFIKLRKESTDIFEAQKDKYDALLAQGKEREFEENHIKNRFYDATVFKSHKNECYYYLITQKKSIYRISMSS